MKKLLAVSFLSVSLLSIGMGQAKAETEEPIFSQLGPYCIILTNFCDRLEVEVYQDNEGQYDLVAGVWDYTCDGFTLVPVFGQLRQCQRGEPPEYEREFDVIVVAWIYDYYLAVFEFDLLDFDFELWGFAVGSPPFYFQVDQPFSYTFGPCGFSAPGGGGQEKTSSVMSEFLKRGPQREGPVKTE